MISVKKLIYKIVDTLAHQITTEKVVVNGNVSGDLVSLSNTGSNKNTFYGVSYGNMDLHIGVDQGGTVAGIWSNALNDWVLNTDGTNVNLPTSLNIGWTSVADFVTEQGTATSTDGSIWRYRKWKSGTRELWCNYTMASVAITTSSASYGGYRSAVTNIVVPEALRATSLDGAVVTASKNGGQGSWINYIEFNGVNAIRFMLSAGTSMTPTNQTIQVYARYDN